MFPFIDGSSFEQYKIKIVIELRRTIIDRQHNYFIISWFHPEIKVNSSGIRQL